nr:putative uncharacterized protein YHR217C [Salvelinus alpinus]
MVSAILITIAAIPPRRAAIAQSPMAVPISNHHCSHSSIVSAAIPTHAAFPLPYPIACHPHSPCTSIHPHASQSHPRAASSSPMQPSITPMVATSTDHEHHTPMQAHHHACSHFPSPTGLQPPYPIHAILTTMQAIPTPMQPSPSQCIHPITIPSPCSHHHPHDHAAIPITMQPSPSSSPSLSPCSHPHSHHHAAIPITIPIHMQLSSFPSPCSRPHHHPYHHAAIPIPITMQPSPSPSLSPCSCPHSHHHAAITIPITMQPSPSTI